MREANVFMLLSFKVYVFGNEFQCCAFFTERLNTPLFLALHMLPKLACGQMLPHCW